MKAHTHTQVTCTSRKHLQLANPDLRIFLPFTLLQLLLLLLLGARTMVTIILMVGAEVVPPERLGQVERQQEGEQVEPPEGQVGGRGAAGGPRPSSSRSRSSSRSHSDAANILRALYITGTAALTGSENVPGHAAAMPSVKTCAERRNACGAAAATPAVSPARSPSRM